MKYSNMWTHLDVHHSPAGPTCSTAFISIIQVGGVFILGWSSHLYFPTQNLSSAHPMAGENDGLFLAEAIAAPWKWAASKDKKRHFFQTLLHTLHWPFMKSSSSLLVVPSLPILLLLLEWRRQLTQFKNILWPEEKRKWTAFWIHPLSSPHLSWLWSFFPRADVYSQILENYFFKNSNGCFTYAVNPLQSLGCHAPSWMVCWCFSPRHQAPQDTLPLKIHILTQPL